MVKFINKYKYLVLFIILCAIQYRYLKSFSLTSDFISNFITFLSIVFGFYITSLAIFVTSRYVANLYKFTDKNNKDVTLLHALVYNYKRGLTIILASILYFLVLELYFFNDSKTTIPLSNNFALPALGLFIINFMYSYKMLKDLINIILQEAKENSKVK